MNCSKTGGGGGHRAHTYTPKSSGGSRNYVHNNLNVNGGTVNKGRSGGGAASFGTPKVKLSFRGGKK